MPDSNIVQGKRLKQFRETMELSQIGLAKLLGLASSSAISQIESGCRPVSKGIAEKIRARYGVPPDYFWWGDLRLVPHHIAVRLETF